LYSSTLIASPTSQYCILPSSQQTGTPLLTKNIKRIEHPSAPQRQVMTVRKRLDNEIPHASSVMGIQNIRSFERLCDSAKSLFLTTPASNDRFVIDGLVRVWSRLASWLQDEAVVLLSHIAVCRKQVGFGGGDLGRGSCGFNALETDMRSFLVVSSSSRVSTWTSALHVCGQDV
jgi:hypothetical protein